MSNLELSYMKISHKFIALLSAFIWFAIGAWLFMAGLIMFLKKLGNGHELSACFALLFSWFFVHFKAQASIAKYTHASFGRMETTATTRHRALMLVKEHVWVLPLLGVNFMMKFFYFLSIVRATVLTTLGLMLLYGAYSYFGMRTYSAVRQ